MIIRRRIRNVGSSILVLAYVTFGATPFAASAVPEIFGPGLISGPAHDAAPAFAADGNTVYFSQSSSAGSTIVVSQRRGDAWSTPQIAPFSGQWSDMEPSMAPDGSFLIFVSARPIDGSDKPIDGMFNGRAQPGNGGNLWRVRRDGSAWGSPQLLSPNVNRSTTIFAPSIAGDGSVYFMEPDRQTGKFALYRSQYRGNDYEPAERLSFSDGTSTDVDPAVAPDESFIVFGSGRAPAKDMDLFIAFREGGQWAAPIHMGTEVNQPGSDAEARLSPDHRTLYFSSERTTPVHYPRSHAQAESDLKRLRAWDNGQYNIWRVSLAPWLDSRETK